MSNSDSKTEPKSTPALISGLVTFNHAYSLLSMFIHPLKAQAAFLARKEKTYKVRVVFSKPFHTVRVRGDIPDIMLPPILGPLGP